MFKETEVDECEIIVIGHLKWNPYFGEKKEDPPRGDPSTCTSVLVSGRQMDGKPFRMLIDPTQRLCAQDYYFDLNRRTGLHPQDITHCFCTHEHFDHQVGLNYFRNTIWLAAEPVAEKLLNSVYINGKKIQGIKGEFLPGVKAVWLPGHTKTIHGVSFWYQSRHVLVAGDSVMTKQHFRDNTTMFEEDAQMAAATIQNIKKEYDIVIPGHDNMLVNNRTGDI